MIRMREPALTTIGCGRGARKLAVGWWRDQCSGTEPLSAVLARRDVGAVFRFLRARGYSMNALSNATGISTNQVRQICAGRQLVKTYDVLERIADGLLIPRGLMGMAYSFDEVVDVTFPSVEPAAVLATARPPEGRPFPSM